MSDKDTREEAIRKELPCGVIHAAYPEGTTCLDCRQSSIDNPTKYGEELKQRYLAYDRTLICDNCWAYTRLAAESQRTQAALTKSKSNSVTYDPQISCDESEPDKCPKCNGYHRGSCGHWPQRTQAPSEQWMKEAAKQIALMQEMGTDRGLSYREHKIEETIARYFAGTQAQAAQKWIRQSACSECDSDGCAKCDPMGTIRKICSGEVQIGDDAEDALKSIAGIIDAMSESAKSLWISVEEKLPELYQSVLFKLSETRDTWYPEAIYMGQRCEVGWWSFGVGCGGSVTETVTHWMPLPVAPVAALEGKPCKL